ncbi:MAG: RNA polymerase sigma factor [Spirochaetales bacterium]|nr:RNA polymerase sigma factor [Spirochaetales bacterium]
MSENAELDDNALIERVVQADDRSAFEALVRRHLGLIRRQLAVCLWSHPEVVDEAEQEVLWQLYRTLKKFRKESRFTTFLFGLCRHTAFNVARSHQRSRQREQRWFLQEAPDRESRETREDPSRELLEKQEKDRLWVILGQLPEPERSLLYLKEAEGAEIKDLAKAFSLPEGTVKSKLARTRTKFRTLWEGQDEI